MLCFRKLWTEAVFHRKMNKMKVKIQKMNRQIEKDE